MLISECTKHALGQASCDSEPDEAGNSKEADEASGCMTFVHITYHYHSDDYLRYQPAQGKG